jgi:hypothetical protein
LRSRRRWLLRRWNRSGRRQTNQFLAEKDCAGCELFRSRGAKNDRPHQNQQFGLRPLAGTIAEQPADNRDANKPGVACHIAAVIPADQASEQVCFIVPNAKLAG